MIWRKPWAKETQLLCTEPASQISPAAILTTNASSVVLKKNAMTPWTSASRRMALERYGHIRGLRGGAEHEGEVQKVEVFRFGISGKVEATLLGARRVLVELVRVVQCESSVDEEPGAQNRDDGQRQVQMLLWGE